MVFSVFTFVVAMATTNVDMRVPGAVLIAAKYLYYPVELLVDVLPPVARPTGPCAFDAVRGGLGFIKHCVAQLSGSASSGPDRSFGPVAHVFHYRSGDLEYFSYSMAAYFLLLNLLSVGYRQVRKTLRKSLSR